MIYLLFNEGYSASAGEVHVRIPLCEEAIRLARLLLRLFPSEPEIMGLMALLLLQHARAAARLNECGEIVLLEDQDRRLWNRELIGEGQLIVNWEAYPEDVAALVHAHPTQDEALGEAALALAGKPLHAHN